LGLEEFIERLHFLDPDTLQFSKDNFGRLILKVLPDCLYEDVRVLKAFPLTDQPRYLSVRDKDNQEIGLIKNLDEIKGSSRKIVDEELEKGYFIPTITGIYGIRTEFGTAIWDVETDKGRRAIEIRGEDSYHFLPRGRIFITDVYENQFQIPDISRLDSRSQSWLTKYL